MESPIRSLRRLAGRTASPEYRCALCSGRYDRDRLNCPACGSTVIEKV